MTFQQREQDLMAEYPNLLKFDGYVFDHHMPLKIFLKTMYGLTEKYDIVTNNPVVNYVHTKAGADINFQEVFLLTKYYFPYISLQELKTTIAKLVLQARLLIK